MPLVNKIAFGAWAFVAACFVIWALDTYEPDFSAEYQAAVSRGRHDLRIGDVSCVSIDPRKIVFDQQEYENPELAEDIAKMLSIKDALIGEDTERCPWRLDVGGISGRNYNVSYGDHKFARYHVSVSLCERASNEQLYSGRCLSKGIYVFNRSVGPHELFLLGLGALAKPQAAEWEVYRVRKEQL